MINLDTVTYWIKERERIRVKHERGDARPWTNDPILRQFRFCNVRREDDRVTKWIDTHIRKPYADHQRLWLMLCIARVINLPETLAEIIPSQHTGAKVFYNNAWPSSQAFHPAILGDALEDRALRGKKVFTSAYIITAPTEKGAKKTHFVAQSTLGSLWNDRALRARFDYPNDPNTTMQNVCALLMEHPGWGPFMAYQVAIDLRHTRYLRNASDINTWAAAGPGTLRGLNRVYGLEASSSLSQDEALTKLKIIRPLITRHTGMEFELSEITGIMCETDKYLRVKNKEGQLRANYVPASSHVQGSLI